MMRFMIGLAVLFLTVVWGLYTYNSNSELLMMKEVGLEEALGKRDEGQNLQERIRNVRKVSMVTGDDQKFTIERLLDIGSPGMEFKFVGQPRVYGGNRALYRHTWRIAGPARYADSLELSRKLATLPGFVVYKYCFGCALPPKGSPPDVKMVQLEGYLYVYDPALFY
ncbi:MAG: hypothetical protein WAZ18_03960 [Alphaproteobacteria bacterium]